jgi:hypothetical protein
LAGLAGISPRTIYAIEVEGVKPQRATQHVLALALGISVTDLEEDERRPVESGAVKESGGRTRHDQA